MPDHDDSPLYWPIARLKEAYAAGELSPVEVTEEVIARIDRFNPVLHAYLARLDAAARDQARAAEAAWRDGEAGPLCGIPVSIKDTFPLAGAVTTYGSALFADNLTPADSGVVRRLRAAGAIFPGKTNAAEFGQSATTDNLLGREARNPWDTGRTPGGSSGGAAASVAAGLAVGAVGADGGGSIRIPAAFTGLYGIKPTYGSCRDEGGFAAMSDFIAAGPLTWRAADSRIILELMAERDLPRTPIDRRLRIAWCPRPEKAPVDPGVAAVIAAAVANLAELGHDVEEVELPLGGWADAFDALVLAEEGAARGHFLDSDPERLTDYERKSLIAARQVTAEDVARAHRAHDAYRARISSLFETYDLLVLPTTATTAFPVQQRPREVAGQRVSWLWGAFPATAQFNVAGNPAASLPCGLTHGLPVGLQIVVAWHQEALLLNLSEDLETAIGFDVAGLRASWALAASGATSAAQ